MKPQQGSTLIIVLIVLLLITIIGAIATKSGTLGLRLATNNQAGQLLMEMNDSTLFSLENPDPNFIEQSIAKGGLYDYFNDPKNAKHEVVFCYNTKQVRFYKGSSARGIIDEKGIVKQNNGFCSNDTFSTGRNAVITQVYVTKINQSTNSGESLPVGTSIGESKLPFINEHLSATVVSVLPGFSGGNYVDCFKKTSKPAKEGEQPRETVQKCLKDNNVSYNVQNIEFKIGNNPTPIPQS